MHLRLLLSNLPQEGVRSTAYARHPKGRSIEKLGFSLNRTSQEEDQSRTLLGILLFRIQVVVIKEYGQNRIDNPLENIRALAESKSVLCLVSTTPFC